MLIMGRRQESSGKSFRILLVSIKDGSHTLPLTFTVVSAANINTLLHTNLLLSFNKSKKSKFDSLSTFIAFPQQWGKHLLRNLNYNPALISIFRLVW